MKEKRKMLPAVLTLTAGAIVCIVMTVLDYEIKKMLSILLITLISFYILGSLFKMILDRFEKQNEIANLDEGEVIEKEAEISEKEENSKEETEPAEE